LKAVPVRRVESQEFPELGSRALETLLLVDGGFGEERLVGEEG
jgi:hypothetical protein